MSEIYTQTSEKLDRKKEVPFNTEVGKSTSDRIKTLSNTALKSLQNQLGEKSNRVSESTADKKIDKNDNNEFKYVLVGNIYVEIPNREPDFKTKDLSFSESHLLWKSPDGKNDTLVQYFEVSHLVSKYENGIEKEDYTTRPIKFIQIGSFDEESKKLIEGECIKNFFGVGKKYEGKFDKDTGELILGKTTFDGVNVQEGEFDKDTGELIKGKETSREGEHRETEGIWKNDIFIGKKTFRDGTIHEGKFDRTKINIEITPGNIDPKYYEMRGSIIDGKVTDPKGVTSIYKNGVKIN